MLLDQLRSADLRAKKGQKLFGLVSLQFLFTPAVKHVEVLRVNRIINATQKAKPTVPRKKS